VEAFTDDFAPPAICQMSQYFVLERPEIGATLLYDSLRHVFISKIDSGFYPCSRAYEPLTPFSIQARQAPVVLSERKSALGFGFGCNEVRDGFGARQIHSAVFYRPPSKFAWLRRAKIGHSPQASEQGGSHCPAAVRLKLYNVFARVRTGGAKPENDSVIYTIARRNIEQPTEFS
jgi:hypothetical protein